MKATFDLTRFVAAQDPVIDRVKSELADCRKRTHWMWFVFPQFHGLGRSETAQLYAVGSLEEAKAYLAHPLLGARLVTCTALVNTIAGRSARDIFGSPDDIKFRSSMTLFGSVPGASPEFRSAIDKFFGGEPDAATLRLLDAARSG